MPLRSGRYYLKAHKCQVCLKFYSHTEFNYKCSYCFNGGGPEPYCPSPEELAATEEWVNKNTINPTDPLHSKYVSLIKHGAMMGNMVLLAVLRNLRDEEGKLLRASHALELFRLSESTQRGHVVGSYVADWWNIRTQSAGGEWPPYVVCYYGNFDSPYVPKMPPRPPRGTLNCLETTGLLRFLPKKA